MRSNQVADTEEDTAAEEDSAEVVDTAIVVKEVVRVTSLAVVEDSNMDIPVNNIRRILTVFSFSMIDCNCRIR